MIKSITGYAIQHPHKKIFKTTSCKVPIKQNEIIELKLNPNIKIHATEQQNK